MRIYTLFLLTALSCFTSCTAQSTSPTSGNGVAVVELFTSEGCSSCPPAEAVLQQLHSEYGSKVKILEFHVDYWNRLGWKDVFSSHDYTLRQQEYAQRMGLSSNYTPQAIVNGRDEMVGSNKDKLVSTINKRLVQNKDNNIKLSVTSGNGNVAVSYNIANAQGIVLNIALVQKNTEVNVKSGENSGRKLKHINTVRAFKTINDGKTTGTISLDLPSGLSVKDCSIIAYAQQKNDWKIISAAESDIN